MSNHLRTMIDRELTASDRLTVAERQALASQGLSKNAAWGASDYEMACNFQGPSPLPALMQNAIPTPEQRHAKRLAIAQKIAADARRRNTPICQCDGCKMDRALPAVLRIIEQAKRRTE